MADLTHYGSMETIDLECLNIFFVKLVQSLSSEALIGIVEYYPEEGFVPKIKKYMAENLEKTSFSKYWPGTRSTKSGKIDYYSLKLSDKGIKQLYTLILSYFNHSESDATLDFFIEDDEEVILFIVAHEDMIELSKKFLNNSI